MSLSIALEHRFPGLALDIRFEAPAGVTALFGRSGSGKTTIINAVAGLMRPDRGRVEMNGRVLFDSAQRIDMPVHRRGIGYVFQEGRLFPHLTVSQNIAYGGWATGRRASREDTGRIVDLLGIRPLLSRRPAALSGGEKQRVAIGRALLAGPDLLLMDEPLAALDEARKAEILPFLERIRDETDIPILYVSHSVAEVARLATTVVAIEAGQVIRSGPAARILSDPHAVRALGVRSAGALLRGRIVAHHADGLSEVRVSGGTVFLPRLPGPIGQTVRLRIEAQDVILSRRRPEGLSALNVLAGTVAEIVPGVGPGVMVQLKVGEEIVLARITRRSAGLLGLAVGQECFAITKTVAVHPEDVGTGGVERAGSD